MIGKQHTMRLSRSTLTILLLGVSSAAMQPALAAAPADITEITVSATKNPVEAFSTPSSVSVVSRDEIDDLMASNISDVFASVPGLIFDGGPRRNGQTPAIRGMAGEGVVVLFDGVRQSFLSGHDGRFFIEPDLLKSAEVVRGAGSSLYGSGAVGGVISLNTVDAADLLKDGSNAGYRLSGGYQDVNEEWLYGATVFGRSADGKFDAVASLSFRDSGDIALGNDTSLQADDSIASGIVKASYQVTDALKLSGSWLGYRNDAVEPNNGLGNNTGDLMDKNIVSDTFRAGLDFNPETNLINFALVGYVNKANVKESDLDTDRVINRDVETVGVSFDNRSRFEFSEKSSFTLTYGGEYYRDEQVGSDNNTSDGTRGGVPDATAKTLGLFVQGELVADTPIGEFILIPGVRYDKFKNSAVGVDVETSEGKTSPKFAVSWSPVDEFMIFGSYSEAFRAPSYNEIFADDLHFTIPLGPGVEAPNFFIPNQDLRPEHSKTWEFGAGIDFTDILTTGDRLTFKGAYFNSDVTDLIDLEVNFEFSAPCFVPGMPGTCNAGTSRNINTGSAELKGFELEGMYDSEWFRLMASYSDVDGKDKDTGDYVGILSPNRLYMSAEAKMPSLDSRLGARVNIASRFDKVNAPADERPGYETLDLFLVWQPDEALEGLRIDLGVDNVFDTEVQTVFAGVVDPGRNMKARISWTGSF
ncbi:TonB-dependent hemoglobin/transferrin/lactoferrin family receptor [Kordiimonas sp.]|uniref:TonB-dependent hemoglobin/transferrin/lactoferrin family receptor n=1 Tax=Kordiimonas sp. TaxID=1970157 RepID=UPI003A9558C2